MDLNLDGARLDPSPCRTPVAAPSTPPARPPPRPPSIIEMSSAFLPASLTIPGLQRISNNMSNEVHTALTAWRPFWAQLKVLEALLVVPERRSRFVWTCLRGSPLEMQDVVTKGCPGGSGLPVHVRGWGRLLLLSFPSEGSVAALPQPIRSSSGVHEIFNVVGVAGSLPQSAEVHSPHTHPSVGCDDEAVFAHVLG